MVLILGKLYVGNSSMYLYCHLPVAKKCGERYYWCKLLKKKFLQLFYSAHNINWFAEFSFSVKMFGWENKSREKNFHFLPTFLATFSLESGPIPQKYCNKFTFLYGFTFVIFFGSNFLQS
jgi:tellurite resistance protein TehA-like permease